MEWNLEEAISYYKMLGAPRDQSALTGLLREIQQENGGSIPGYTTKLIAKAYDVRESLLLAIIRRIPSLRLENVHCMEICSGPNCGKHTELAECAESLHTASGKGFVLRFAPCMRQCGKGPNLKWNGLLFNKADPSLLQKLLTDAGIEF